MQRLRTVAFLLVVILSATACARHRPHDPYALYKFKRGPGVELTAFPVDSPTAPCHRRRGHVEQIEARARGFLYEQGVRGIYRTHFVHPVEGIGYVVYLIPADPVPPNTFIHGGDVNLFVNRYNLCVTELRYTTG